MSASLRSVGLILSFYLLIGQVQISLIKLYLLSNPLLDPASTEISLKVSFGFALGPQMCVIYQVFWCSWSSLVQTVVKTGSMQESGGISDSAVLQCVVMEQQFASCFVLASVCVLGIPTTILYAYLATQGMLV